MLTPFTIDQLTLGGLILIFLGGFGLLLFVSRHFAKNRKKRAGKPVKRRGFIAGLLELAILFLFLLAGLLALSAVVYQKQFRAFTEREVVLEVRAFHTNPRSKEMVLQLHWPREEAAEHRPERVFLRGDQFEIEGNVLLWDDFLTALGFKSGFKLTRLRGRYLDPAQERGAEPTVISLSNESLDRNWQWLYRNAARLPGIRAVHGQTVYTFPDAQKVYQLRVSHDGFTLEEKKDATWKF